LALALGCDEAELGSGEKGERAASFIAIGVNAVQAKE